MARTGALRCIRRNVAINGVDPWAMFVRYGRAARNRGLPELYKRGDGEEESDGLIRIE